jgi:hypothetical protein
VHRRVLNGAPPRSEAERLIALPPSPSSLYARTLPATVVLGVTKCAMRAVARYHSGRHPAPPQVASRPACQPVTTASPATSFRLSASKRGRWPLPSCRPWSTRVSQYFRCRSASLLTSRHVGVSSVGAGPLGAVPRWDRTSVRSPPTPRRCSLGRCRAYLWDQSRSPDELA